MGFKLGKERGLEVTGGEIKSKMRFGKQSGDEGSVPGTPVIRVPLEKGILGEANMDGSIFVNEKLKPGSFQDRQTIMHEMRHATERKDIKGVDSILVDGKWKEAGDTGFPWENDANNGNI